MNALAPISPSPDGPVADGRRCDRGGCPCLAACLLAIGADGALRVERLCWPHGRATYRALRGLPGVAAGLRPLMGGER